jgi:energy-coupling factor transporter transmembrane protein EcfT
VIKFSPTAKILLYILLIIAVFLSNSIKVDIGLLIIVLFFGIGVPPSVLKRGIVLITFFLAFTFFSNILFQTGKVVFEVLGFTITEEGLKRGCHLTLRLFILVLGAKILTATTSMDDLMKAVILLLGPLGKWKPVKDFVSTMSLTVRFLPIIYDEARAFYTETFKNSQSTSLYDKIKRAVALLVPLFERSIKKAKDLSVNNT